MELTISNDTLLNLLALSKKQLVKYKRINDGLRKKNKELMLMLENEKQSRALPVVTVGDAVTDKYRDKLLDSIHELSVDIFESEDTSNKQAARPYNAATAALEESFAERRKTPRGDVARGLVDAALVGGDVQDCSAVDVYLDKAVIRTGCGFGDVKAGLGYMKSGLALAGDETTPFQDAHNRAVVSVCEHCGLTKCDVQEID